MKGKILGILTVLIVLCICLAFATADPWWKLGTSKFLQPGNIQNLLNRLSLFGILGIGVAFVIITSGIDLSIGSTVCFCGVLLSVLLHVDYQPETSYTVRSITASDRMVVLDQETGDLKAGQTLRFTGGIGSGLVLTVESVESANGSTSIRVAESLTRDEKEGRLVRVNPVQSLKTDPENEVLVQGPLNAAAGDQLLFVKADGALTTRRIQAVTPGNDAVAMVVDGNPGDKYGSNAFVLLQKRHQRASIPVAVLTVLGVAVVLGLYHGLMVTKVRLQPFVVTLCGLLVYRGWSRQLANDQATGFGELQDVLAPIANGKVGLLYAGERMVFGIPIPFFILMGVALLASVFLSRTIWGRYMLALGKNEEAARFSGINTGRMTIAAYVICTVLAAIGGMLFAIDSSSVSPTSFGNSFELYAIAAAVLGGCSLRGGEGSILGVVIGTAVMQVLNNMIVLLKIPEAQELPVIGYVILFGVLSDELVRRAAARRRLKQSAG